jgi:hypothetical protein
MALGSATFSDLGGAVSDLFASSADSSKASGLRIKAQGDALEGQNYDLAASLARQNEQFTEQSTAIKQTQLDRQIYQTIGGQQADVAGAGFAASGSALDLMRDSAQQGALTKDVLAKQGQITEAGYTEQAASYDNLSKAAQFAVQGDNQAADAADSAATGSTITGIIKGIAGVASIFAAPATGGLSLAGLGSAFMGGGSPSGYGSGS